ncbi:MAG: hypothetical protein WCS86_03110 [Candidatus Paceibacterota bacterium]
MDTTVDLLKIKIDKARGNLSEESRQAIDAIDWKTAILGMRAEKGYSFTQLEDLEIETELLLCGLINPEDYPKELEKRMVLPRAKVDELINEMNEKVFSKIREELIKITEKKKPIENNQPIISNNLEKQPLELESREELLKKIENPIPARNAESYADAGRRTPSILTQKLTGSFQMPTVKTEHSIPNVTKIADIPTKSKTDPYRELPE